MEFLIKPYVGVRLASNIVHIDNSDSSGVERRKQTKFGYGILTGFSYSLDKNLALNAGIEYNRLGGWEDTNVNQYGAKIGLRYEF